MTNKQVITRYSILKFILSLTANRMLIDRDLYAMGGAAYKKLLTKINIMPEY